MLNDIYMPLGKKDGAVVKNPFPGASRLVIGPSGTSKSTGVVTPLLQILLPYQNVCVTCNDPKDGEQYAQFKAVCEKHGRRRFGLIDDSGQFGFDNPDRIVINNLNSIIATAEHKPDELFFAIETATHGIIPEVEDGKRNYIFREYPRQGIHLCIRAILETRMDLLTMGTVYSSMADPITWRSLREGAVRDGSLALKARAQASLDLEDREPEAYYKHHMAAVSAMQCYEPGSFLHSAGEDATHTHDQLAQEGWMVFHVMPQRLASRIGIHMTLHQQCFMDAQLSGRGGHMINIIDEMCNSSQKDEVERVTIQRSYNKANVYIAQTLADIEQKYGKHQLNVLMDNCPVIQFLGFGSETDAEKVSRAMGEEIAIQESMGINPERMEITGNISTTKQRVMSATELLNLPPEKQVIYLRGYGWIVCDKLRSNNIEPTCHDLAPNPLEGNRVLPPDPKITLPTTPEELKCAS